MHTSSVSVGAFVGRGVGALDGAWDGAKLGDGEGDIDGERVGFLLGGNIGVGGILSSAQQTKLFRAFAAMQFGRAVFESVCVKTMPFSHRLVVHTRLFWRLHSWEILWEPSVSSALEHSRPP